MAARKRWRSRDEALGVTLIRILLIVALLAGCGGDDDSTATTAAECAPVDPGLASDVLAVDGPLGAVRVLDPDPALGENTMAGDGWVVATTDGAAWLVYGDLGEGAGPVVPLNDQARAASELGVDVAQGAPMFRGIGGGDPAVAAAVSCASS